MHSHLRVYGVLHGARVDKLATMSEIPTVPVEKGLQLWHVTMVSMHKKASGKLPESVWHA